MKSTCVTRFWLCVCFGLMLSVGALAPLYAAALPENGANRPATELTSAVASLVGVWEGKWDAVVRSRLIVEEVNSEWAHVVYEWADDSSRNLKAGSAQGWLRVHSDGRLHWAYFGDLTFELSEDYAHLVGTQNREGYTGEIVMQRVDPLPYPEGMFGTQVAELPLPVNE